MRQGEHGRDQTTQCLAGHRKGRDHSRCDKGRCWKILNTELTWETSGGKEKNKSQLRYHVLSAPARSRRRLKVWNRPGRWRPARPADRRSVLRSVNGASSRISLRRRVAAERSQPPRVHAAERSQLPRGARTPGHVGWRLRQIGTENCKPDGTFEQGRVGTKRTKPAGRLGPSGAPTWPFADNPRGPRAACRRPTRPRSRARHAAAAPPFHLQTHARERQSNERPVSFELKFYASRFKIRNGCNVKTLRK